jgi:phenylacetate-CoA ligase
MSSVLCHPILSGRHRADCEAALALALEEAPFFARWKSFDPGPSAPVEQRYVALPILTKRDLRAHMPTGFVPRGLDLRSALADGTVEMVSTSGTSEDRSSIVWHQPWWDASELAAAALHRGLDQVITGRQREAVLTSPVCAGTVCHIGDLSMEDRTLGRLLFLNRKAEPNHWSTQDLNRMAEELALFQPELLEADPAYLAVLARHAADHERPLPSPGFISLTYEFPSRLHYRQIRRAFPATPILSSYGSTEAGHVFTQCEHGRFHQNTAYCRVDFQPLIPRHGGPLVGRLIVTILRNPWFCLLRFDTGDLARLAEGPCPCGRTEGLTLGAIEGRMRDLTFAADGGAVTLSRLDSRIGGVEGLLAYQAEQVGPSQLLFRFVSVPGEEAGVAKALQEPLQTLYGSGMQVTIQRETAISAEQSGKFCLARARFPWTTESLVDESAGVPL